MIFSSWRIWELIEAIKSSLAPSTANATCLRLTTSSSDFSEVASLYYYLSSSSLSLLPPLYPAPKIPPPPSAASSLSLSYSCASLLARSFWM
jgi:hypothetical protein